MIRYVADPSEERLMKSTLASGKPVGYVNSSSCCSGVLVNQSAESVTSLDLSRGKGADEV
jgi:hypothetical protein